MNREKPIFQVDNTTRGSLSITSQSLESGSQIQNMKKLKQASAHCQKLRGFEKETATKELEKLYESILGDTEESESFSFLSKKENEGPKQNSMPLLSGQEKSIPGGGVGVKKARSELISKETKGYESPPQNSCSSEMKQRSNSGYSNSLIYRMKAARRQKLPIKRRKIIESTKSEVSESLSTAESRILPSSEILVTSIDGSQCRTLSTKSSSSSSEAQTRSCPQSPLPKIALKKKTSSLKGKKRRTRNSPMNFLDSRKKNKKESNKISEFIIATARRLRSKELESEEKSLKKSPKSIVLNSKARISTVSDLALVKKPKKTPKKSRPSLPTDIRNENKEGLVPKQNRNIKKVSLSVADRVCGSNFDQNQSLLANFRSEKDILDIIPEKLQIHLPEKFKELNTHSHVFEHLSLYFQTPQKSFIFVLYGSKSLGRFSDYLWDWFSSLFKESCNNSINLPKRQNFDSILEIIFGEFKRHFQYNNNFRSKTAEDAEENVIKPLKVNQLTQFFFDRRSQAGALDSLGWDSSNRIVFAFRNQRLEESTGNIQNEVSSRCTSLFLDQAYQERLFKKLKKRRLRDLVSVDQRRLMITNNQKQIAITQSPKEYSRTPGYRDRSSSSYQFPRIQYTHLKAKRKLLTKESRIDFKGGRKTTRKEKIYKKYKFKKKKINSSLMTRIHRIRGLGLKNEQKRKKVVKIKSSFKKTSDKRLAQNKKKSKFRPQKPLVQQPNDKSQHSQRNDSPKDHKKRRKKLPLGDKTNHQKCSRQRRKNFKHSQNFHFDEDSGGAHSPSRGSSEKNHSRETNDLSQNRSLHKDTNRDQKLLNLKDPPPGPNFVEEEGSSRLQRTRAADDQRLLEPGGSQESLGSHDNHSVRPHDQRGTEDLRDQPCSNRIQQQNFSGGQRQDNSCQIQQNHDESEDYQGSNPSQSGGSRSPNQSQANSDISHWDEFDEEQQQQQFNEVEDLQNFANILDQLHRNSENSSQSQSSHSHQSNLENPPYFNENPEEDEEEEQEQIDGQLEIPQYQIDLIEDLRHHDLDILNYGDVYEDQLEEDQGNPGDLAENVNHMFDLNDDDVFEHPENIFDQGNARMNPAYFMPFDGIFVEEQIETIQNQFNILRAAAW